MTDSVTLAATLSEAIAHLQEHIDARARELAAPRIEAAERAVAELEAQMAVNERGMEQRLADLQTEFRRQWRVVERARDQGAWLVRYLPHRLRTMLADPGPSTPPTTLTPQWLERVERAAEEAGVAVEVPTS